MVAHNDFGCVFQLRHLDSLIFCNKTRRFFVNSNRFRRISQLYICPSTLYCKAVLMNFSSLSTIFSCLLIFNDWIISSDETTVIMPQKSNPKNAITHRKSKKTFITNEYFSSMWKWSNSHQVTILDSMHMMSTHGGRRIQAAEKWISNDERRKSPAISYLVNLIHPFVTIRFRFVMNHDKVLFR